MIFRKLLYYLAFAMLLASCEEKGTADVFDDCAPVDLTKILRVYEMSENDENADVDSLLQAIVVEFPEEGFVLFDDTSFVLRVPEYVASKQPFLAKAEDFYNSSLLAWNVWSNHEVWYRDQTANGMRNNNETLQSIKSISVNIIKDPEVRRAAQTYEDSLLLMMSKAPDEWPEGANALHLLLSYSVVIESKAYRFYDDEKTFVHSLDSVMDVAEGLAMDRFQHYVDACGEDQLKVILGELSACRNFDEQCSLWRNWANCKQSIMEGEWILAVGALLMESDNYSPVLHRVWLTWRALCQTLYFGISEDSFIPNHYYNEYRKKCYITCLKRIERHPDDHFAMNCAAALGGRTNMGRLGSGFGNEAIFEEYMMMPKRYESDDDDDDEDDAPQC